MAAGGAAAGRMVGVIGDVRLGIPYLPLIVESGRPIRDRCQVDSVQAVHLVRWPKLQMPKGLNLLM